MTTPVELSIGTSAVHGDLTLPADASGVVVFAHGAGSSRRSPRNMAVARNLQDYGLGTLLFDLLTEEEEHGEQAGGTLRFDVTLLSQRLLRVLDELAEREATRGLAIGLFGASTGAGAALAAADSFWWAVLANGMLDGCITAGFVATATTRQSRTPNHLLGRVSGASAIANSLARVLGAGGVGIALAAAGGRVTIAIDAAVLGVAGVAVLAGSRSVPVRTAGERATGHPERDQPEPGQQRDDPEPDEELGAKE